MKEAKADSERKRQAAAEAEPQTFVSDSTITNRGLVPPSESENSKSGPIASTPRAVGAQIQNIAGEIVSEIRSARNKDGSRSVEIEFDSKTLQGLQVMIREQQGTLSILFSTQSENVAALLNNHKPDLISALASDGFKTGSISTSVRSKQIGSDRGSRGQSGG
jgi:flagellar hook-length control protein FliK